jgi:hypothetical protein
MGTAEGRELKVQTGRQRGFQHLFVQARAFPAALDVPPERLPKGVTQKRVKRLARGGDDVGLATTIAAGAALTLGLR